MNKQQQVDFIEELVTNVKVDIKQRVRAEAPESWDGVELRQYIADKFSEAVMKNAMSRSRRREYNNTIRVSGNL